MNDEIKEILEYVLSLTYGNENAIKGVNKLLDYITNLQHQISLMEEDIRGSKEINDELQQENDDLKNRLENAVADCYLRLQENERLKEENKHIFSKVNDDELLISNAMNYAEAQDYKSRCEKAIEYLDNKLKLLPHYMYEKEMYDLLNILQNGSDSQ